jgi:hypothetical protein
VEQGAGMLCAPGFSSCVALPASCVSSKGGKSPSAPRWISTALGSDEARYLAVRFLIAPV